MATPAPTVKPTDEPKPSAKPPKQPDKRLKLEDVLKLMVADGLITTAQSELVARSRTKQYDHPLQLIAAQQWKSVKAPHRLMILEWLVEWLAGKLKVPYLSLIHI